VGVRIQKNIDEGHLRVVQRRRFWPTREKETRDFRKLHNEELHNLYLGDQVEGNKMCGAYSIQGRDATDGLCEHRDESEGVGVA
jgi:hypothetical protein